MDGSTRQPTTRTWFSVRQLFLLVAVIATGFAVGRWGGPVLGVLIAGSGMLILRAGWKRGLLISYVVAMAGFLLSAEGGQSDFSPDTLNSRFRSERLLIVGLPVYQSGYRVFRYELVEYLIEKGYWQERDTGDPQWVPMTHWSRSWWRDGDTIYYHEFRHGAFWIDWSEEHPSIAAVLWPTVLRLLRRSDVDGATLLLRYAEQAETLAEFRQAVASEPYFKGLQLK